MIRLVFLLTIHLSMIPLIAQSGDVISDLGKKLKFLSTKQSVISQNIANSNTPDYKARSIKDLNNYNMKGLRPVGLRMTSNKHIGNAYSSNNKYKIRLNKNPYDTSIDGNNVILDEQVANMAKADLEYQKTVGVMRQINGLVRSAIGGNR